MIDIKNNEINIKNRLLGGIHKRKPMAEEAAEAVEIIDPKVVVPMHYDSIVGTKNDALRFEKLCSGRRVALLERKS